MSNPSELEALRAAYEAWEANTLKPSLARVPERREKFVTTSSE